MKRAVAAPLLKELGDNQIVNPDFVIIEQKLRASYQLEIKGNYDLKKVEIFLKNKFSFEESKDYLIIFKP